VVTCIETWTSHYYKNESSQSESPTENHLHKADLKHIRYDIRTTMVE